MDITLYTDGAATKNGKPGCKSAWAYAIVINDEIICTNADVTPGTLQSNNRGELTAIIEGLLMIDKKYGPESGNILVVTDSMYCINSITKWYHSWVVKDLLSERKNIDLISHANLLTKKLNATYEHVRAHQKSPDTLSNPQHWKYNKLVDKLAEELALPHM